MELALIICVLLSAVFLLIAAALSFRWLGRDTHAGTRLLLITLLSLLSVASLRLPTYLDDGLQLVDIPLSSLVDALQTLGTSKNMEDIVSETRQMMQALAAERQLTAEALASWTKSFITYAILQYAAVLLMCGFAIIRVISSLLQRFWLGITWRPVFFFSELTEESLLMAGSIQRALENSGRRAKLCFCCKGDERDTLPAAAWDKAGLKNPILLSDGLSHRRFPRFSACVNCILCSSDEHANLTLLSRLLEEGHRIRPLRRREMKYFIFAQSRHAEQAVDMLTARYILPEEPGRGSRKARRRNCNRVICMLNPKENLAVHVLDQIPLHEYAAPTPAGGWKLNILIAGSTPLAERFLRNAYAVGQMLDCTLSITLADPEAEQLRAELLRSAPMLRRPELPVVQSCGELHFRTIDSYAAVADEDLVRDKQYILLAGEDDKANLRAARRIHMLVDRQKLTDPWRRKEKVAIVYTVEEADLNGLCRQMDAQTAAEGYEPCVLRALGSREAQNHVDVLFGHELLRKGFLLEEAYSGMERLSVPALQEKFVSFMNRAYDRRSSVSAVLHLKYRQSVMDKLGDAAAETALTCLEHRRWNAFMIMSGFMLPDQAELESYFYQGEATQRELQLRLHPCLVPSKPVFTRELWNDSVPAEDELDQLSRDLQRMRVQSLRQIFGRHGQSAKIPQQVKQSDKAALKAAAQRLPDPADARRAGRIAGHLFTDYKEFDLEIIRYTREILRRAADPEMISALRLFWMEGRKKHV